MHNMLLSRWTAYALVLSLGITMATEVTARSFNMPSNPGDSVIEEFPDGNAFTIANRGETLLDIARRFSMGQTEIVLINPDVDRWLPEEGSIVKLPNRRILPNVPHEGIVINLPEFRMYYFPAAKRGETRRVLTYPISIGRQDWRSPLGITRITEKVRNPVWRPPESIKREHAAKGDILPDVVPAGPDNPLGLFAMRLGLPGYLIHSTNKPFGIGMMVTHGCVRMYPEDMEQLFQMVPPGTPVHFVNQPVKVGWLNDDLYIEIHPDLEGEEISPDQLLEMALNAIIKANQEQIPIIDGEALNRALQLRNGMPVAVYTRLRSPQPDEMGLREASLQHADN